MARRRLSSGHPCLRGPRRWVLVTPLALVLIGLFLLPRDGNSKTHSPEGVIGALREALNISTATTTTWTTTRTTTFTLPNTTHLEPRVVLNASLIAWMHFPKAGSSFSNVIISWACPELPDNKFVSVPWIDATWESLKWELEPKGGCVVKMDLGVGHSWIQETGERNSWAKSKGHFVGMFKHPEQRLISGFKYGRHGLGDNSMPLMEYVDKMSGCVVRMIIGVSCNLVARRMTRAHVQKAIERVDEGFAFVGLTEEWDMSVCLFHAMFGGDCKAREFKNINFRKENKKEQEGLWNSSQGRWNEDMLMGFKDRADGPLYDHVTRVFDARLRHYKLDWGKCNETCFKGRTRKPRRRVPRHEEW